MRMPAEQRRRQLMDVARDVFAEKGFHATSMDDIAGQAGVTKPVLYQHFDSKRALYVELLGEMGNELLERLVEATVEAGTMHERVNAGFRAYFRFVASNASAFKLLFGAAVRNDDEFAQVVGRVINNAGDAITTLIDAPMPDEQRRIIAHALVGMAEATSRQALLTGEEFDPDALATWVSEVAWYGLRGVRAGDADAAAAAAAAAQA